MCDFVQVNEILNSVRKCFLKNFPGIPLEGENAGFKLSVERPDAQLDQISIGELPIMRVT